MHRAQQVAEYLHAVGPQHLRLVARVGAEEERDDAERGRSCIYCLTARFSPNPVNSSPNDAAVIGDAAVHMKAITAAKVRAAQLTARIPTPLPRGA